jgi:hypothetical protein
MSRWLLIALLFGGLSITGLVSGRGVEKDAPVHTMEDGSGFPPK